MKINLPKNFLLGSALSGPQTEGKIADEKKSKSVWDEWYLKEPQKFYQHRQCENDFLINYQKDIELAKKAGMNSLRTSLQWTRIMPDGVNVDHDAIELYGKIIDCMIANGIEPIISLHHFDMPLWLHKKGGWSSRDSIASFAHYAKACFEAFKDRVKIWATFNEPDGTIDSGYLALYHPPGIVNFKLAMKASWNIVIAHFEAVKIFRTIDFAHKAKIGIISNFNQPLSRSTNPQDLYATRIAKAYMHRIVYPMLKNKVDPFLLENADNHGFMWEIQDGDLDLIGNRELKIDFLGINYYTPSRIQAPSVILAKNAIANTPWDLFTGFDMPYKDVNPFRGWEVYPQGIYENLMMVKNEFDNIETYISENGFGCAQEAAPKNNNLFPDDYRIEFMKKHLAYLLLAIQDGANCIGYHMWTYIDNWSWANAYKNRYGIIGLNLVTHERYLKKSFNWFKSMSTEMCIEVDFDASQYVKPFLGSF